jgi:hypothetical protein
MKCTVLYYSLLPDGSFKRIPGGVAGRVVKYGAPEDIDALEAAIGPTPDGVMNLTAVTALLDGEDGFKKRPRFLLGSVMMGLQRRGASPPADRPATRADWIRLAETITSAMNLDEHDTEGLAWYLLSERFAAPDQLAAVVDESVAVVRKLTATGALSGERAASAWDLVAGRCVRPGVRLDQPLAESAYWPTPFTPSLDLIVDQAFAVGRRKEGYQDMLWRVEQAARGSKPGAGVPGAEAALKRFRAEVFEEIEFRVTQKSWFTSGGTEPAKDDMKRLPDLVVATMERHLRPIMAKLGA